MYSLASNKTTAVTDGMSDDFSPSFDPEGKYLYFISRRTFRPEFGGFEFFVPVTAVHEIRKVVMPLFMGGE